jgi:hypothetical protein
LQSLAPTPVSRRVDVRQAAGRKITRHHHLMMIILMSLPMGKRPSLLWIWITHKENWP